jgi:hypothetical protein
MRHHCHSSILRYIEKKEKTEKYYMDVTVCPRFLPSRFVANIVKTLLRNCEILNKVIFIPIKNSTI